MSEPKFTQAKWKLVDESRTDPYGNVSLDYSILTPEWRPDNDGHKTFIAALSMGEFLTNERNDLHQAKANAALIAAAPDLYAAADELVETMSDTGYYAAFKKQLDALKSALAKATGE